MRCHTTHRFIPWSVASQYYCWLIAGFVERGPPETWRYFPRPCQILCVVGGFDLAGKLPCLPSHAKLVCGVTTVCVIVEDAVDWLILMKDQCYNKKMLSNIIDIDIGFIRCVCVCVCVCVCACNIYFQTLEIHYSVKADWVLTFLLHVCNTFSRASISY